MLQAPETVGQPRPPPANNAAVAQSQAAQPANVAQAAESPSPAMSQSS